MPTWQFSNRLPFIILLQTQTTHSPPQIPLIAHNRQPRQQPLIKILDPPLQIPINIHNRINPKYPIIFPSKEPKCKPISKIKY